MKITHESYYVDEEIEDAENAAQVEDNANPYDSSTQYTNFKDNDDDDVLSGREDENEEEDGSEDEDEGENDGDDDGDDDGGSEGDGEGESDGKGNAEKKPDGDNNSKKDTEPKAGKKPGSKIWNKGDPVTISVVKKVWSVAVKHGSTAALCKTVNTTLDSFIAGATAGIGNVVSKGIQAWQFVTNKTATFGDTVGMLLDFIDNSTVMNALPVKSVLESSLNSSMLRPLFVQMLTKIVPIMEITKKAK